MLLRYLEQLSYRMACVTAFKACTKMNACERGTMRMLVNTDEISCIIEHEKHCRLISTSIIQIIVLEQ
jgi:hypothetical protein